MILKFVLRVLLLGMGLVFFASLLLAAFVVLAVWLARAMWAKLMGRPVAPWHFRFDPQARWRGFQGAAASAQAARQAQRRASSRSVADITDVVVKDIKPADGAAQH
jgi:hypothetical protein